MSDVYAVDSNGGKIPVTLIYKTIKNRSLDEDDYETSLAIGVIVNGRRVLFENYLDVQQFVHPESGETYEVN